MNEPTEIGADGIPAATVVIFRHSSEDGPPEILMTIRSRKMVFAGGMAVFPGGRVDPADFDLGARIGGRLDPDEAAHQIAVVRETLEETGLVIGLTGEIDLTASVLFLPVFVGAEGCPRIAKNAIIAMPTMLTMAIRTVKPLKISCIEYAK